MPSPAIVRCCLKENNARETGGCYLKARHTRGTGRDDLVCSGHRCFPFVVACFIRARSFFLPQTCCNYLKCSQLSKISCCTECNAQEKNFTSFLPWRTQAARKRERSRCSRIHLESAIIDKMLKTTKLSSTSTSRSLTHDASPLHPLRRAG